MSRAKYPKTFKSLIRSLFELLGSMRFAVSLLTLVCVVSVIGTVLPQHEAEVAYLDRFGVFWFEVLRRFSVDSIYNATWFLVVMGFLVVSTVICLIRNVPKMLRDMRNFREYMREQSIRAFPHRHYIDSERSLENLQQNITAWLSKEGYRYKIRSEAPAGMMIAAKKGTSNRWGYIFAHLAIVVVCLGGLLDSELPLHTQIWLDGKRPIPEEARFRNEVPPSAIFAPSNMSFRGNVSVSEGAEADFALLDVDGNRYLQSLPFDVHLNKFIIEYYEYNGMPKRFASDVTITDYKTGRKYDEVIEVNHPFTLHGITLYQSSFHDGGSILDLIGYNIVSPDNKPFDLKMTVGETKQLDVQVGDRQLTYQITMDDFRPLNIENFGDPDVQKDLEKNWSHNVMAVTGSAAKKKSDNVRNVGPSFTYSIRDASNQSVRFQNYMLPIVGLESLPVFLLGVQGPNGVSYIRIPMDKKGGMDLFLTLRASLDNPTKRQAAVDAFVKKNQLDGIPNKDLARLASVALEVFAQRGFVGINDYIEGKGLPAEQRLPDHLKDAMRSILQNYLVFTMVELTNDARQQLGMSVIDASDQAQLIDQAKWLDLAMLGLSDLTQYPSPIFFKLKTFKHVQGSVLQATRSPGQWWVYLGCVMLAFGVFAMFYIRERRIWIWLKNSPQQTISLAMTSPKRTLDFEQEFQRLCRDFEQL